MKTRNPQDANVHKLKVSLDVLRGRLKRLEQILRTVHPTEWRATANNPRK